MASIAVLERGGSGASPDQLAAEEQRLVEAARSDASAFGELYDLHHRSIWRYLRHRTGESHAADDLVAEVFVEFLRRLPTFRVRGIGVRGWLYRVATRTAARWSKSRRSAQDLDENSPARPASDDAADEARARVREALNTLPQRWQAVLVLHHLEGLAVDDIADSLRLRPGTVRSRLARGRAALRRELERRGVER